MDVGHLEGKEGDCSIEMKLEAKQSYRTGKAKQDVDLRYRKALTSVHKRQWVDG
jgi:hypothetical protein